MKLKNKLIVFLLVILTASCTDAVKESEQNFDWLLGTWVRINNEENKKTFENWEKKNESEYVGFSFTMQQNDTLWQEKVKLLKEDEHWSFDVTGEGEAKPTKFIVVKMGKENFVCENQTNEFPKKIAYSMNDKMLHSVVSGNDMEIIFDFKVNKR